MGVHLAGLIFFLNPGLPFEPLPVLRGILVYAALLGVASLALHLPFTWGRPRRARRALPWGLTVALTAAAALDWTHASYFAYYLPPGINERLIKTALWLSLGALISFYTALLHSLQRRRYGVRSRTCYGLLAVLSVYAMVERREGFQPRPGPIPRPAVVEAGQRPRLLVIGLDTATLDAILPLAGQDRLPFLATVLREGAYGRLESISPPRPEALWTTLATGKYPYKHEVIGRLVYPVDFIAPGAGLRLRPTGINFRLWGTLGREARRPESVERDALALWEVLPRLGLPSGAVGWPATAPGRGGPGFALDDRFFAPQTASGSASGSASGGKLPPRLRELFGPNPPPALLDALAGDLRRESVAASRLEQTPEVQALFLMLPGLRAVSRHDFGGFNAVQFEGSQAAEARQAADRVAAYYAELDAALARLWGRQSGPRLLVVVSASGVSGQQGWRRLWGGAALQGRFDGAQDGALLLYGEGIRPGALLTGARLVDLAPTLLYGLGFPVARDLDGKVITAAFDKGFLARHPLNVLPSYEALELPPPAP